MKTVKFDYIRPEIYMVALASCDMLATSNPTLGISDTQGEASDDFARGHRGGWGNLWGDGE